jgi:hypothetical protein
MLERCDMRSSKPKQRKTRKRAKSALPMAHLLRSGFAMIIRPRGVQAADQPHVVAVEH